MLTFETWIKKAKKKKKEKKPQTHFDDIKREENDWKERHLNIIQTVDYSKNNAKHVYYREKRTMQNIRGNQLTLGGLMCIAINLYEWNIEEKYSQPTRENSKFV